MKRAWLVLVLLGVVLLVGPAQAQDTSGLLFSFGPGTKVISQTSINASVQGDLTLTFRGDPAAGCATYGLCAYSGTIVVQPRTGDVNVLTLRRDGRISHSVRLDLGSPLSAYTTSARVTRSVPGGSGGTCADAQSSFLGAGTGSVSHGGTVTVRVLASGGTLLQTRCAGPLDGDLSNVSPATTVRVARLLRGRMTLDLSGTRSFAVHGLAGRVSSTLRMKLATPGRQQLSVGFPPGVKTHRVRTVIEQLTLVRVGGGLTATVQGTSNPIVCGLLDTCGLTGTLSLSGGVREASAAVIATRPASRPYRDFLAALDVSRSGRARGIAAFGSVFWVGDVRASVSQSGSVCTDTATTGGVALPFGRGLGGFGGFVGSWRTRCPGPSLENAQLLRGVPLDPEALRHRQFTIEVRGNGTSSDDGYVIAANGRLSIVLRRGRITQQVTTQPTG